MVAVKHEIYVVIRNGESPSPQRERTWQMMTGGAVAGFAGLVGVDRAFQTDHCRSHAVTSRRQSGHPIVTPMMLVIAAL